MRTTADGAAALAAAREDRPDAVVLDVMLPDMSGLEVLGALREQHPQLPVLLLTAKDAVEDRIAGLSAGGDDYVTKPFSLEEVVLRLRSLLRRTGITAEDADAQIVVGDLVLDEGQSRGHPRRRTHHADLHRVRAAAILMHNPKRVLSKTQILDRVWSYDFGGRSNIVELYISYLRKEDRQRALADDPTLRGAGYVPSPARKRGLTPVGRQRLAARDSGIELVPAGAARRSDRAAGGGLPRHRGGHRDRALHRYLVRELDNQLLQITQRSSMMERRRHHPCRRGAGLSASLRRLPERCRPRRFSTRPASRSGWSPRSSVMAPSPRPVRSTALVTAIPSTAAARQLARGGGTRHPVSVTLDGLGRYRVMAARDAGRATPWSSG